MSSFATSERSLDDEFPGRVLIAEANQWPKEVAQYLGTDDEPECHMAFDFPIMPRIFYALRSQQTASLNEVLSETTEIPQGAAWGVFLRNHDELTLEMVTDEEKQALYGWYAYDPRMRVNVGIRRRLATTSGQLPQRTGTRARPPVVASGQPLSVLRGRNRHGRQYLARGQR
jgi:glycosidase